MLRNHNKKKTFSGIFNEQKVQNKSIYMTEIFCSIINVFKLTFD